MSNNFTRTTILIFTVSLTLLFSGCGYFNNSSPKTPTPTPTPVSSVQQNQFAGRDAEFTKLPAKVQLVKEPYLAGKIKAYERQAKIGEKPGEWRAYSNLGYTGYGYSEKFEKLQPSSPEEVKTVILKDCRQIKSGDFEIQIAPGLSTNKPVPGYGWKCEITLVDKSIGAVVYRKTFESDTKAYTPVKDENVTKVELPPPTTEIKQFVENLPVR